MVYNGSIDALPRACVLVIYMHRTTGQLKSTHKLYFVL
jgi:hypothetical protein